MSGQTGQRGSGTGGGEVAMTVWVERDRRPGVQGWWVLCDDDRCKVPAGPARWAVLDWDRTKTAAGGKARRHRASHRRRRP